LSTFEPQFNWASAVINEEALPIVVRSVNPRIPGKEPIIASTMSRDIKVKATTSTEMAITAQQYVTKNEVPKDYQKYMRVFSEEESKRYPPKRAWDHAIEFKKDAPDSVDCKVYPMN